MGETPAAAPATPTAAEASVVETTKSPLMMMPVSLR